MTTEGPDDYEVIQHFGVKGMKWGVRRVRNRDARTSRLKSGTATKRDKLIREADLDGGRTQAMRKGEIKPTSKTTRVGMAAAAGVLIVAGAHQLRDIRK